MAHQHRADGSLVVVERVVEATMLPPAMPKTMSMPASSSTRTIASAARLAIQQLAALATTGLRFGYVSARSSPSLHPMLHDDPSQAEGRATRLST